MQLTLLSDIQGHYRQLSPTHPQTSQLPPRSQPTYLSLRISEGIKVHHIIHIPIEQILRPVKAQVLRDDADLVLPEQPFPDSFGFVNGHGDR